VRDLYQVILNTHLFLVTPGELIAHSRLRSYPPTTLEYRHLVQMNAALTQPNLPELVQFGID
jgi:hypothetical protein